MSEISVTVNGSTTINPAVGNGDTVNVTFSATGERGPKGDVGSAGPATKLSIGTVVTGADAAATLTGTAPDQTLSLVLPQGATGSQGIQGEVGPAGPANSLAVGSVTTGETAAVTITGNSPSQAISFVFEKGPTGATGAVGPATTVQVGTVTTSAPGTSAKIDTLTSGSVATLNFTIPRGVDGTANLGDETPQPLGVASAGSAGFASRADHVHAVPTISYANLSGVPTTFAPATHSHAISDVTNLQAVLDGKQVAGTYATLVGGTVPSSQLPSFVDDVIEHANLAGFPATGEVGKLFVARDTNKVYRWSGTTYIEIASSPGSTDVVVEGTTNLYFTTKRAADAAPVQSVNGKTGEITIEAGGIAWSTAPTATTTTTTAGQLSYDDNFLYVANAVNQWRRVGIEDWTTPTITISVQPASTSAVGATATFSVTATASQNAELLYQWQRQAGGTGAFTNIATGLSATLPLADLSYAANNGDKYRVVISSGAAGTGGTAVNGWLPAVVVELTPTVTVTSGVATLTVAAAISIVTQPQAVTLTTDTSASFSISATTPGTGLAYQWQSSPDGTNWTAISGATAATFAISGATETGYTGTRYRCIVSSSGYDDATSNAALLTVAPITVTAQPANKTGTPVAGTTPNYSVSFAAAATSPAGPPTLQWQVSTDGGTTFSDVSGQTSSSLALTGLTTADSGKRYRARFARTGWNNVSSNDATLTVPTDAITLTQQPSNTTASVSQFSSQTFTLPAGTWDTVSFANNTYFATPSNQDAGGDYIATSGDGINWTKRVTALPNPGLWSSVEYGNGLYITHRPNTTEYARSTDGITWTTGTLPAAAYYIRRVEGIGWFAYSVNSSLTLATYRTSTDGVTWSGISFFPSNYGNPYFAGQYVFATRLQLNVGADPLYATITNGAISSFTTISELSQSYLPVAFSGSNFLFADINILRRVDFAVGSTAQGAGSVPGGLPVASAVYHSPTGRWVIIADAPSGGGGFYTSNGTSVAARLSLSLSTNIGMTSNLFLNGSRVLARIANSTVSGENGWYTSDDGGLSWTYQGGSTIGNYAATQVGSRFVAQSSFWGNTAADTGVIVDAGGLVSAQFASAATTTFGNPAVQWQQSTDGGATWANITSATSPTLSLTPVSADSGKRYRAVYTKDQYTTVNSNAAILTVP